ncbi:porin [Glaciimonas sp. PAMC28666]|nr:porin [Glaciimonas sp. PAMC28666]QRX84169.1 porin [Glaciimonas sp. PAMC28666]
MLQSKTLQKLVLAGLTFAVTQAFADSSVTIYGVADSAIVYQNNQSTLGSNSGGLSSIKESSGIWAGSRLGFKGTEDIGGGTKAIFQLEIGYSIDTGAAQYAGVMFGRQAFVGISDPTYGTLTAGRQYTAYYLQLAPYSPTTWLSGALGAHPGDLDGLDTVLRSNNTLLYTSPTLSNFTAAGSYSLGEVAGSVKQGSTWSLALQYKNGPFGMTGAVQRVNNSTPGGGAWGTDSSTNSAGQPLVSAVTNGYQTDAAQQRATLGGGYNFTPALDISVIGSNVQYIPGANSKFTGTAIFNTLGSVLHYRITAPWDLAVGYSYTKATQANGIQNAATYHQFTLSEYYNLSKRTGLYAIQTYQQAGGKTLGSNGAGNIINATATIGDGFQGTPSSSNRQVAIALGIVHRF